jgi:RNA polymerase primary sigma factor
VARLKKNSTQTKEIEPPVKALDTLALDGQGALPRLPGANGDLARRKERLAEVEDDPEADPELEGEAEIELDEGDDLDLEEEPSLSELDEIDESEAWREERAALAGMELSDDPVRQYLKEIGQVPLLTSTQEIWLSTQINAAHQILKLRKQAITAGLTPTGAMALLAAWHKLQEGWKRLLEDCKKLRRPPISFPLLVAEARELRHSWQTDADRPSALRGWLDNGAWGRDTDWAKVAESGFEVFMLLYLLPRRTLDKLEAASRPKGRSRKPVILLPQLRTFKAGLPPEPDIEHDFVEITHLATNAGNALVRANLRLVVSVA